MAPQVSKFAPITEQVEKISCWKCGKKFKKQKYLNTHISYHHSFPCQSCGTSILGSTCRIHQRSTEESKVQFVENGKEGSQNELVGTATEDSEIEFIGAVSGKEAVEKYFPMGDEEHQEDLDSIVGLANATFTNVGLDHLNTNHFGNGLAHVTHANSGPHGGYTIHNGVHQRLHEGFPVHNGGHLMYFDGQSMQLSRKRKPEIDLGFPNDHKRPRGF